MKTPLENISSRNLYYFAIIPIWPNYSATEHVERSSCEHREWKIYLHVHVLHNVHFTLLFFCRGRRRNVSQFVTHVQSRCLLTFSLSLASFLRNVPIITSAICESQMSTVRRFHTDRHPSYGLSFTINGPQCASVTSVTIPRSLVCDH